jgi:hypothetical protein
MIIVNRKIIVALEFFIIEPKILYKIWLSLFHWEKERMCDRERDEGGHSFLRAMEYVIGFFIINTFSIISHFNIWNNNKYE